MTWFAVYEFYFNIYHTSFHESNAGVFSLCEKNVEDSSSFIVKVPLTKFCNIKN